MSGFWRSVRGYLDSRFALESALEFGRHKKVPEHEHSIWYYFGGLCLFLFVIQVITGLLLLLYYNPTVGGAHDSIRYIMSQVKFGWLIRSVHSWTANILIGAIFIHMFSAFFMKAYRPPRELTWMSGFFLLVLFMGFGFSGYLLPWNELSFFGTRVGTDIAGSIPLVGKALKTFILGGPGVTEATLGRFFWLHVAVLPAAALLVAGVHVLLIQTLGMSRPVGMKPGREISFFPQFILRDALGWLIVLGIIGVICVFIPWEIGTEADPFAATPLNIKPEWYFTFMFTTLKVVPAHILSMEGEVLAILGFMLGGLLWLLVPFLDRRALREEKSPAFTAAGALVVIYIVVLTALTYLAPNLGK